MALTNKERAKRNEKFLKVYEKTGSIDAAAESIGVKKRWAHRLLAKLQGAKKDDYKESVYKQIEYDHSDAKDYDNYIVTCAINNVSVDPNYLAILEYIAEKENAKILVVPILYRNPSLIRNNDEVVWDQRIRQYLLPADLKLSKYCIAAGSLRIQATARKPLTSCQHYGDSNESVIIAHPVIEQKFMPVHMDKQPRMLVTTGAVTKPVYSETLAGARSGKVHTMGALFVSVDKSGYFRSRHLTYKKNKVHDLDNVYTYNRTEKLVEETKEPVLGMVVGDLHWPNHDVDNFGSILSLAKSLKIENIVWHDVQDLVSIQRHHVGKLFDSALLYEAGKLDVMSDFMTWLDFEQTVQDHLPGSTHHIVQSNHTTNRIEYYLNSISGVKNAHQYKDYIELASVALSDNDKDYTCLYHKIIDKLFAPKDNINFLSVKRDFKVGHKSVYLHGHHGPGGTKGSPNGFATTGLALTTGHIHTPYRYHNYCAVGTSSKLDMGYNKGLSGWSHTHELIYSNGTSTLINLVNKSFI